MSRYFLMGGFIGFAVVFFLSFASGAGIDVALRNGMVGCMVMALLVKFLCGRITAVYIAAKLREWERLEKEKAEENL